MIDITEQDFDEEVLECEIPVFACFTTEWCHSCFPTCLLAKELAEEYDGSVKFVRLDTERSPKVAERYRITAVPTIILFQKEKPMKRLLGFQYRSWLKALLNSALAENNTTTAPIPEGKRRR
jgi:thioredoxin 1